ncbi:MAG: extracellular solute-binding protein [Treponema sp.]|jgi:multiple sugar transport system substrate-binding protein|nr:extracellular solute-binding protein [Treponema sp.]
MKRFTLLVSFLLIACISFSFAAGGSQQAGRKTVLRVAHFYDPASGEAAAVSLAWLNTVKAEFERQNPNAVVEWEVQKWDEIDVKLLSDFRSNITDHDVSLTSPQLFPLHAEVGDLEDMAPFIKRDWSAAQIAELSWASTYQQGFQNGKQIGLPLGSHARVFIWNKDHFRAAGLDPEKPPRTLDEVIEYGKKLTIDKDGDGVIDQYGFGMNLGPDRGTIENTFSPFMWGFGGDSINPTTKAAVFADANGVKVTETIWDMVNTHKIVPPDAVTNTFDIGDYFMGEKTSMSIAWGSYHTVRLEQAGWARGLLPPQVNGQAIKVGIAQYPTATGNDFTNSWAISIYQKSKNKELAWKFIDTLFKSNLNEYPDAGLPIKQSEWQKPEYQTPYFKVFNEAIRIGKPMPQTPYYGDLADTLAAALQRCLSAPKSDISRILQEAQQEYNSKAR